MKKETKNPLQPFVTIERMAAYEVGNPKTSTGSLVTDAVCEAFARIGYSPRLTIADELGVDPRDLSGALRIICGLGLREVRLSLTRHKLAALKAAHPDWSTDQMARHLGFADRSALFRLLGTSSYDAEVAKFRRGQGYTAPKQD